MAIASGMPVPPVYVIPEESINAFAAGYQQEDAIVAVSEGCMKYLTRDELQGVVAHEFSHILNGDMKQNIRILGIIFGILALGQIGMMLMRARSSNSKDSGGIVLLGVGLFAIGFGGVFFGRLIQAAISRQREFLADASAVQFTRNPDGITGALKKIGGIPDHSTINAAEAGEISHMFFSDAFIGNRLSDIFATHPPLADRIRRLDPDFDGTYPYVRPVAQASEEKQARSANRLATMIPALDPAAMVVAADATVYPLADVQPEEAATQVGNVTERELGYAHELIESIPLGLREAAQQAYTARAVVYCLLLDHDQGIRDRQLLQLASQANSRDHYETLRLSDTVRELPDACRLPLIDLTIPALLEMSPGQYETFRQQVEGLIQADGQLSLFEYTLHTVVLHHLDATLRPKKRVRPRNNPDLNRTNMSRVLSLLAKEGSAKPAAVQHAYEASMRRFVGPTGTIPPAPATTLTEFDAALQSLALCSLKIEREVMIACATCVMDDRKVTIREAELLRAIGAVIGCPKPALILD